MSHLVKTTSKDILARAMAQEDITVQHSASAQTAAFDVQNRCLILPVWKDMDNSMYDMLVGHEVSHALHTPAQGWQDFVGNSGMRHMFVNVVEDARIERMIKAKFPGLRRDFAAAYASLHDRDLFEISNKDVSSLALIDRLNLHFKIGLHCQVPIPFSADEQQYVTRMEETTTFDEVVELARELYEMQKEEDEKNKPEEGEDQQESGQETGGAEGADSSSDDSESGTGSDEGEETDGDGEMQSSGSGGDEEVAESGEESGSGSGESGEDSGMSMEDDTDDGESAEGQQGESSADGEQGGLDYDDYSNAPGETAPAGATQRSFEQGMEDLRDEEAGEWSYATLPTPNLENIVVDYKTIESLWDEYRVQVGKNWERGNESRQRNASELQTYLNSIKGTVNQMVQAFQMKQAAEADKRTEIAKTGVLDTNTMINYRWSEDIFVKNEVHADGKSHGMVMYVDWSGSMSGILKDTVEQLLVLVEFCRKVNIPFEVYAFSSNVYSPADLDHYSDEYDKWREQRGKQWNSTDDRDCRPHEFSLYNFLSSRMNKREFATGLSNFWNLTLGCHSYAYPAPRCLSLGCTPLNEAIWCAIDMVPAFQRANGVQIVNTVFLTDGEGHGMVRGYSYRNNRSFVTDKKTKKSYEIKRNETDALLNMLRDRTGTNLVGVRLHDAKHLRFLRYNMEETEYVAAEKQYKKENFVTLPSAYDEYFIVKGDLKVETDAMEGLDEDASMTRIKNAFIKGGTRKKASRVIANRMVDIFAA